MKRTSPQRGTESLSTAEDRSLVGAIAAIRAMAAVMTGQDAEAISLARHARELLPAGNLWDRTAAAWALGYALHSQGHLPEARSAFEEQVQLGRAMSNIWTLVTGLTDLAQVLRDQGKIRQARALLEEALAEASQRGARNLGFIARTEANLASVLYEQNELGAARRLLSDALTHAHFWPNPNHLAFTYALLARVLRAEGDLHGAWMSIGEADRIRRSAALTRLNRRMVEADLVRVWLALQAASMQLAVSESLADQAGALVAAWRIELAGSTESMDEASETAALTLARVSLAAGRSEEALSLLERVTQSAQPAGQTNGVIGALVLTAIAWQTCPALQGKPAGQARGTGGSVPAFTALEEALGLAEPGGYVRVFLDEGQPMQMLLAQWLAHAGAGSLRDYAILLLSQFDVERHVRTAAQEKASSAVGLVEPLSQRELEVLHLMALGRTNQEIARQLVVSPGTVKAHTAGIYRKLDVANRTEAAVRARQLGILPEDSHTHPCR